LEFGPIALSQQIEQVARQTQAQGAQRLHIFPLFLLPGTHVCSDIPQELAQAQAALQPELAQGFTLQLHPYLGEEMGEMGGHSPGSIGSIPDLGSFLQPFLQPRLQTDTHWILLAHGSRRPQALQAITTLCQFLDVTPAYWANPPSLETQVEQLHQQGAKAISLLPYFLFQGGITDGIARQVDRLGQQYGGIQFELVPPLTELPGFIGFLHNRIITTLRAQS
jgi:sirohydrochlorin ferrochelatase